MFDKIRPLVFWPSFLILMAAVVTSFVDLEGFLRVTKSLNATVLESFSWLFSLGSFYLLSLIVVVGGSLVYGKATEVKTKQLQQQEERYESVPDAEIH